MFGSFSKKTGCAQSYVKKQERMNVPYLLVKSLMRFRVAEVKGTIYLQDALSEIEPFARIDVKLYKPSPKRMPEGYSVPEGSLITLLEDGTFIGYVMGVDIARSGLASAKTYPACVIPPCDDSAEGFSISDRYDLWLIERF